MRKEIILLDGGMGQELIKNSKSKPHPLWSTYVMSEEPELVKKAHVDFIEAGATVITLNTYSTTPERLEANNLSDKFSFFHKKAIDLARAAIDQTQKNVLIAGCLPPLVWSYRPDKAPDYEKCVEISTQSAIREMIVPGLLAVLTPVVIGFLFGPQTLGGLLAGVTVTGVLMAIFQSNSGGAWDNAKKMIEEGVEIDGNQYGKGSDMHKAAVVGDTVGDPFKDTSGPSLNILIKLMSVVSLVIAPLI